LFNAVSPKGFSFCAHFWVRFFFFVYEQLLQMLWAVLYKDEVSFKRFLLELSETCDERLEKAERSWEPTCRHLASRR
jgi:hypothetical protein